MVTKKKSTVEKEEKKGRVEVNKLKLNKETLKDLTSDEAQRVKGGTGLTVASRVQVGQTISCVASPGSAAPAPGGLRPPTYILC
jgi:hypothetical protein